MIGYNEASRKYLSIKERLRQAQAQFRDEELRIRRKLLPPPPSPVTKLVFSSFPRSQTASNENQLDVVWNEFGSGGYFLEEEDWLVLLICFE